MADTKEQYPVATLHSFLEEVSEEFKRFRFQTTVNLAAAIFLLLFFGRLSLFLYETAPFRSLMRIPLIVDVSLLAIAVVAVLWSLDVWRRQRGFMSRWGDRFEKLQVAENELMPEDKS
jgi:hypothetical protein